ncbi:methyl-accepting chemotaxis protein [Rhodobacter sp. KR11]|uniref:globin-coupled sensor protein n=1 Tax=Rhodobacter sp. KR11 TaxID=2974588 RepID=UPI0022228548|nr:globin-coupled sensor protein [Rhodobacter sp. KR11]MCW1918379.1 methyl-accepting chemotaxis protein [Rhodobacter sp. KR11]
MTDIDRSPLASRLSFYGIDPNSKDFATIATAIGKYGDRALDDFYVKVAATPETARHFSSKAGMDRAHKAQLQHWQRMFAGGLGPAYLEASKRIGDVHARIGLEPKWYVGGYANILAQVVEGILTSGMGKFSPRRKAEARMLGTLIKVALMDMDMVITRYFEVDEESRRDVIERIGSALSGLSNGDLTAALLPLPEAFGQIERDFRQTLSRLSTTMGAILEGSSQITSTASEIRAASDDLAKRSEQQAASLEESAAAMDELTHAISATTTAMRSLNDSVRRTREAAEGGGQVVTQAMEAMSQIERGSGEIAKIIGIIDDIAFQTNLLALNAGVEAARVGEHGRGFAVVANEVRSLAQSSAQAAEQIKALIKKSVTQVETGVKLVNDVGDALHDIVQQVTATSTVAVQITETSAAQDANLRQINMAINEMNESTQRNAAMVEQSNAAAHNMAEEAARVSAAVNHFKVREKRQVWQAA